jgi:flavin reductase (DIM6/NTAB) family NADH-FMN oxidoreductase RutF
MPGQDEDMTALPHEFDPSIEDPRAFRSALGRFGTGVTVITCATPTGPMGITANSFSSLSLDPPLVMWAPAKSSSRYPFFVAAEHFAIHVMGAEQSAMSTAFARAADPFDQFSWRNNAEGVPVLDGCLARFECRSEATHDGGDHAIVLGRVLRAAMRDGDPLLFFGGAYGGFSAGA